MKIESTAIAGCFLITPRVFEDSRGSFVKTFHASSFNKHQLNAEFVEDFYSFSKKNVIRGMHFQTPPHDHVKLVTCLAGRILDVVVDLRTSSASFGQSAAFLLDGFAPCSVWIPKGCAHGFLALEDSNCVYYKVGSEHSPSHDTGILWSSIGYDWPVKEPIVSERDARFAPLADFESPFP
jgi:dTDP-4-dehydrorhamnose 3,5-epimerase